jgi:hypothetical protein
MNNLTRRWKHALPMAAKIVGRISCCGHKFPTVLALAQMLGGNRTYNRTCRYRDGSSYERHAHRVEPVDERSRGVR